MPIYQFEAMDATGQEIRDEIDAANEEEAQTTIRQMGYFVTKISVKKTAAGAATAGVKKKRPFAIGGGGSTSMQESLHIAKFASSVKLISRRPRIEELKGEKILLQKSYIYI